MRVLTSRRVEPLVPYAACFAVTWGLIGLESQVRTGEIAVAFLLQILVGAIFFQLGRGAPRPWLAMIAIVALLASVVAT